MANQNIVHDGSRSVTGFLPWPSVLLVFISLVAATFRLVLIVSQGWVAWHKPYPWTSILILHLCAEFLMATLPAVGVIAWWRGRLWGAKVMLVGLGAGIYASFNAAGWAFATKPVFSIPIIISLLVSIVICWRLMACPSIVLGPWSRLRSALMVWLVLTALQIYILWIVNFAIGLAGNPFAPQTNLGYLAGRNIAELTMIAASIFSAWVWKRGSIGWPIVSMIALGMFLYALLNTAGEVILTSTAWFVADLGLLVVVLILLRECMRASDTVTFGEMVS